MKKLKKIFKKAICQECNFFKDDDCFHADCFTEGRVVDYLSEDGFYYFYTRKKTYKILNKGKCKRFENKEIEDGKA